MGCDIHTIAQKLVYGDYESINFQPFTWRSYGVFGFLANVRNYSEVPPIAKPRGWPEGFDHETFSALWDTHTPSWLLVSELLEFNYEAEFEDRRVTRQIAPNIFSGSEIAEPGGGEITTYRNFLGQTFFDDLYMLKIKEAHRIVFAFDS